MKTNGRLLKETHSGSVLQWRNRVLTGEDLRRCLNGHCEVVLPTKTVITPLAAEELRTNGIAIRREDEAKPRPAAEKNWGVAQEWSQPMVQSALQSLEREGISLHALRFGDATPWSWAQAVAGCVAHGECCGGVVFCRDPGLVCCVANKVAGLRAVAVGTIAQAARATLTLGANFLAVEMPGRTFFEVKQILRLSSECVQPSCPDGVACTLRELDGHAHR